MRNTLSATSRHTYLGDRKDHKTQTQPRKEMRIVLMKNLDEAIEKANRLKELLTEVRALIDSLKVTHIPCSSDGVHYHQGHSIKCPSTED